MNASELSASATPVAALCLSMPCSLMECMDGFNHRLNPDVNPQLNQRAKVTPAVVLNCWIWMRRARPLSGTGVVLDEEEHDQNRDGADPLIAQLQFDRQFKHGREPCLRWRARQLVGLALVAT